MHEFNIFKSDTEWNLLSLLCDNSTKFWKRSTVRTVKVKLYVSTEFLNLFLTSPKYKLLIFRELHFLRFQTRIIFSFFVLRFLHYDYSNFNSPFDLRYQSSNVHESRSSTQMLDQELVPGDSDERTRTICNEPVASHSNVNSGTSHSANAVPHGNNSDVVESSTLSTSQGTSVSNREARQVMRCE